MGSKKKEREEKAEKPLEKRTIKELRDEALKVDGVQDVHGMNKEELLSLLRKGKGIAEPERKKGENIRDVKFKLKELRAQRDQLRADGASRQKLEILRKKISKIRKKTRRAA